MKVTGNQNNCQCHQKIAMTNTVKYLGIYYDPHLRWDQHIPYVVKKIRNIYHNFYQVGD